MTGHLPANLVAFAGFLRRAGIPVGPGQVLDATRALEAVGLGRRDDVYWALHAVFVSRSEQRPLFELAFRHFWRDPERPTDPLDLLPPDRLGRREHTPEPGERRVREARLHTTSERRRGPAPSRERSAAGSWSATEVLRHRDFEQMSEAEIRAARKAIEAMDLDLGTVPARRFRPDPRGGRLDLRATLRGSLRGGGYPTRLVWRRMTRRPPALVALCDISGSMDVYARMVLHFLHRLTGDAERVHTFLFATRLTNVTRALRRRDVDEALAEAGRRAEDWAGGTRIGRCLESFNRVWSRRVLGQGAVVLLVTDGLDRGDLDLLGRQVERLRKSCRRLVWLNPLLRYREFEPRAGGVRRILPWVDDFRPVHDLESLEALARALRAPVSGRIPPSPRAGGPASTGGTRERAARS